MNQRHHTTLASYFQSKPLYLDEPTQKKPNIRKLVELPWQQTKGELWYEVTNTLCDLDFIQAKAAARMTYDLVNDFNEVLEVIPDNQENIRKEKARQARMDKYTQDLIACAKGEITIDELEIPESITPWTDEQIDQEIERIKTNPTNTDKLKDFLNFLGNESSNLQNYANEFSYFSHQQAWNFNYEGSLGNAATKTSEKTLNKLILRNLSNRPFLVPLRQAIKSLKGHIGPVNTVAFTTDSRRALSGSHDNNCILWNLQNGQPLFILKGHTSSVDNLAITLDGKNAVSCSWKECIYWDLSTGRLLKNLKISNNGITAIAITFDGKRVIAGYSDNSCVIWDLSKELSLRTLTGHTGKINKIESTPDCKYALTESNNEIILWNLETGKTINIYKKDIDYKNRIRMSPNGKLIYLQIEYTSRNIYDEKNGECILSSKGHVGIVNCLEMTHDGKFAISASDDKTCIIWDIEKNIPIRTFVGHTESVNYVVLSPDGKLAISASTDGTCIIWNLENGKENS